MTDQELLTYAAKAAGYQLDRDGDLFLTVEHHKAGKNYYQWNPLENDSDAFQLMVKLRLEVYVHENESTVIDGNIIANTIQNHNGDPYAATRRAIVRAAAEIGKGM